MNFKDGCLSFNKVGDFKLDLKFYIQTRNLELLLLKSVEWNSNWLAFTKNFYASFNSFGFKIGSLIVLRLQIKLWIQAAILKSYSSCMLIFWHLYLTYK